MRIFNFGYEVQAMNRTATKNYITLTTIPPRFDSIEPTLNSLVEQDADIAGVFLILPRTYRKRDFEMKLLPPVPNGVEILWADADLGPATKILPAVKAFRGQNVRLIYCDDDRLYHHDWASRLIAHNEVYPDQAAADAGELVAAIDMRATRDTSFHKTLNTVTLGLYGKPHRRSVRKLVPKSGQIDIAKGYGGVVIRPEFLDDRVFDIPSNLWAVDDIWLSGHLACSGTRVHLTGPVPRSTRLSSAKTSSLLKFQIEGLGRDRLNLACVNYLRESYGIWGGQAAIQGSR